MTILPRYLLLGMLLPAIVIFPSWIWKRNYPTPTPVISASPTSKPSTTPIPTSDPAASATGTMTACQKKTYWLSRADQYFQQVDHNYDLQLALYWQKECNK
jgi:hypothetical protein